MGLRRVPDTLKVSGVGSNRFTVLESVTSGMKLQTFLCCSPEPGPAAGPHLEAPCPLEVGPTLLLTHGASAWATQRAEDAEDKVYLVMKGSKSPFEFLGAGPWDPNLTLAPLETKQRSEQLAGFSVAA